MTPPAAARAAPAAKTPVTSFFVSTPRAETISGSTTEARTSEPTRVRSMTYSAATASSPPTTMTINRYSG